MQRSTAVVWACLLSSGCVVYVQRGVESDDKGVVAAKDARTETSPIAVSPSRIVVTPRPTATEPSTQPVPDPPVEPAQQPAVVAGTPLPVEALCKPVHWPALDDLRPREAAQYVALRVRGESLDALATTELASWGVSCAGSDNPVECEIDVVNAEDGLAYESTTCDPVCKQYYLVTTSGGTTRTWGNEAALRALLGRVDTRGEAVLFAFYSTKGIDVSCAAAAPDLIQLVDGGYEFPVRMRLEDSCPAQLAVASARVAPSGSTTISVGDERVAADAECP